MVVMLLLLKLTHLEVLVAVVLDRLVVINLVVLEEMV